jgi:hypothetical protein
MAKAKQTIKIRVKRTGTGGGTYKPCGTCGGSGVIRSTGGVKK